MVIYVNISRGACGLNTKIKPSEFMSWVEFTRHQVFFKTEMLNTASFFL